MTGNEIKENKEIQEFQEFSGKPFLSSVLPELNNQPNRSEIEQIQTARQLFHPRHSAQPCVEVVAGPPSLPTSFPPKLINLSLFTFVSNIAVGVFLYRLKKALF